MPANRVLCEDHFAKADVFTLISYTNALAVPGRSTLNDVQRFRNGPVREFKSIT